MKKFEHETFHEDFFTAKLVVYAGIPDRGNLFSCFHNVDPSSPVVVIEQRSGDTRSSQGQLLQAIRPADARVLARMLLQAAEEAEKA